MQTIPGLTCIAGLGQLGGLGPIFVGLAPIIIGLIATRESDNWAGEDPFLCGSPQL